MPLLLKFICIFVVGFSCSIVFVESFGFPPASAVAIRLASWNILAQEYIDVEESSFESNINPPPPSPPPKYYLEWKYRRELISNQLKHIDADIICLQEVQVDTWHEFYSQVFEPNYKGYIQDVGHQHNVATATLVKKQFDYKVDRIESRSRALLVVLKKKKKEEAGNNDIPSSNNIDTPTTTLYLWNVHLEAGKQQLNDYHRFCQLKSLFRRTKYHCSLDNIKIENSHIVIAGDFNMLRKHPNYKGLTIGEIENPSPSQPKQQQMKRKKSMKKKKKKQNKPQIIKTIPLIDSYGSHHNNYFPGVNTAHTTTGSRQHYLVSDNSSRLDDHHNDNNTGNVPLLYSHPTRKRRQKLIKTYSGGFVLDYIWHSSKINIIDSLLFHPSATSSLKETWPSIDHPSDHIPIGIELEL